jgi:hypothetical protein
VRRLLGLLVVVAVIGAGLWVGTPLVASALVRAAVVSAGLNGSTTQVQVAANPPLALLLGHADSVRIRSSDDALQGVRIGQLDLVLFDVSLLGRTAGIVEGTLADVRGAAPGVPLQIERISVAGAPDSADVEVSVLPGELATALRLGFARLVPPDLVTGTVAGHAIAFRLTVNADGSLVAVPSSQRGPTLVLWQPTGALPVQLTGATVTQTEIVLTGRADLRIPLGLASGG